MATQQPFRFQPSVAHWLERGGRGAFHVILPISLGIAIYLSCRDISGLVVASFPPLKSVHPILKAPDWFAYNLPDGLWLYASLQTLRLIWRTSLPRPSYPWIAALLLLAFGSELLQAMHFMPGTGDWGDVVAYAVGGICFFIT